MYYTVRHTTKFRYSEPVTESVMEVRMQPRTEGAQRCLSFDLRISPRATITSFVDHLKNRVHHFDLPDRHTQLTIRAESVTEIGPPPQAPDSLSPGAWNDLDALAASGEFWDYLEPSNLARPTASLVALARELRLSRSRDPLTTVRYLNCAVHDLFEYNTNSTDVDSPIDDAIAARRGVCQDFAHITIALVRHLGVPCRYVSGYLFHRNRADERSAPDATHAWVEVFLPEVGWFGLDPTNNTETGDGHIRVAAGRDYTDVPPTRGVFKGKAETELAVSVRVTPSHAPEIQDHEDDEEEPIYRPTHELDALNPGDLQAQPEQQ